jgi:hypothetical protein
MRHAGQRSLPESTRDSFSLQATIRAMLKYSDTWPTSLALQIAYSPRRSWFNTVTFNHNRATAQDVHTITVISTLHIVCAMIF